jgi:hypothetical protein
MDSAFLFLLLAVFSDFDCSYLLTLSSSCFGLKSSLFMLIELGNGSAISCVAVDLATIVTPHV